MSVKLPIYLDHHATTPCDPRVVEAMLPYFTERFGNAASRVHVFGFEAKAAVEVGRQRVAELLGSSPKEIVWTSGATESNNLAILGVAHRYRDTKRHLITTSIEHKAVLDPMRHLAAQGWEVTTVGVSSDGLVDPADVSAALRDNTALVSMMLANNEIGTLQPVAEIGALCRERGAVFHCDAAQAAGRVPIDVAAMQIDLLSLSGHKMYGPKGIGALYVRRGRPRFKVDPILHGGGHERGMRSGTLPVPLIVAMGRAAQLAGEDLINGEIQRVAALRDRFLTGLQEQLDGVEVNGSMTHRLANNLNLSIAGVEAQALMMSTKQLACSSGSACSSATLEPSHVLRALQIDHELAHRSLRFGLGRFTTAEEIDYALGVLVESVGRLRAMNPLLETGESGESTQTVTWRP